MNTLNKLSIVKQLRNIWRIESPWSHIKTKYTLEPNILIVDFDFGNHIILREEDLTIHALAMPQSKAKDFNIGDTKLLNNVEQFVSDHVIE